MFDLREAYSPDPEALTDRPRTAAAHPSRSLVRALPFARFSPYRRHGGSARRHLIALYQRQPWATHPAGPMNSRNAQSDIPHPSISSSQQRHADKARFAAFRMRYQAHNSDAAGLRHGRRPPVSEHTTRDNHLLHPPQRTPTKVASSSCVRARARISRARGARAVCPS